MNTHRTHVTDGLKAAVIIAAFYGILQLFGITLSSVRTTTLRPICQYPMCPMARM